MASSGTKYPDYLNPFGDDDGDGMGHGTAKARDNAQDDYPDDLDPFGSDEVSSKQEAGITVDDYDNSLNPFGEDETNTDQRSHVNNHKIAELQDNDVSNPFAEDIEEELKQQDAEESRPASANEPANDASITPSFESLEPPKPLPRTKSLLKKEQAHKKRLLEIQQATIEFENQPVHSLQSTTSSTTSSSSNTTTATANTTTDTSHNLSIVGSFQRRKNKRLAPPVPVNFKRQVSGSLTEIEEELNNIGDKLAIIDKESTICQTTLTTPPSTDGSVDEVDLKTTRSTLIELIKRRSSIVRRQKELMYMRRELKLDQLHSDIEYDLRMIGNKQLSTRTQEDEAREKELLKKLVEIVEEKNDIVENLNKDTADDSQDVEEAFKRMNLSEHLPEKPDKNKSATMNANKIVAKGGHCDKSGLSKLTKIATLLPRSSTIKMKRKRLFKKNCDSRPVER